MTMFTKNFVFHYNGQRKVYEVTIKIEGDHISTDCECSSKKPCKHIYNLLIGRSEKIQKYEAASLESMFELISTVPEGKRLIQEAKGYFQSEESCRRCNSRNIIDTKSKSLKARLYRALSKHRYYCKDCRWSW